MEKITKLDDYWDFLVDNMIATEDEIRLVTSINGYNKETLDDILYVRTGNRSVEQYCDENDIEIEEESVRKSINFITDKILNNESVNFVLGKAISEGSHVLYDKDITSTDDVDELVLYISNDGNLYRNHTIPIINNLKRKYKNGNYDPELAIKAFMYLVDAGVRKYDKEFVSGQGKLFLDKQTREEIAIQLRDRYEEEIMEASIDESMLESRSYTLGEIKRLVKDGLATDITSYGFSQMKEFLRTHRLDKVGVSSGKYGINGGVLKDVETGDLYAITARTTSLMQVF